MSSISSANAAAHINKGHLRPASSPAGTSAQPVFSRSKDAGRTVWAEYVGPPSHGGPTPYANFAKEMCFAADAHHEKLKKHFTLNPSYFGDQAGAHVFYNPTTRELAIHDLSMKFGFGGLLEAINPAKEQSTCLVKPDGRIIFNGELVTKEHPRINDIMPALGRISDGLGLHTGFTRNKFPGLLLKPAWDPASSHHKDYVA